MHGELPLDLPLLGASAGAPRVTVFASSAPVWAGAALDPARLLHAADPTDDSANLIDAGWVIGGEGLRLRFAEGITFWISGDFDAVWFRYQAPLTQRDAAHFLLEPVLAFVLRRHGTLAFHASAVGRESGAVLFCGASGAGKSTIAGAATRAGALLIADDLVAVRRAGAGWAAERGTVALRLWDDAAAHFVGDATRANPFSDTWPKRIVDVRALGGAVTERPMPLAAIVVLTGPDAADRRGDLVSTRNLEGGAAVRALLPQTAAGHLHDAGSRAAELTELARLVQAVQVIEARVRAGVADADAVAASLLGAVRGR